MPNVEADTTIGSAGYRVRPMDWLWFAVVPLYSDAGAAFAALVRVVYDDGDEQEFQISISGGVAAGTNQTKPMERPIRKYGVITDARMVQVAGIVIPSNALYASLAIESSNSGGPLPQRQEICSGYISSIEAPSMGKFESATRYATWVFQGTVAEDATAGTHVCSLTVTPGVGATMEFGYAMITSGNTATAQTGLAFINDGTNVLTHILQPGATLGQSAAWPLPQVGVAAATASGHPSPARFPISGTMQLIMSVTTAAVSVTQTFAVVLGIRGGLPTTTLADTVGAPALTVNTSQVF